MIFLNTLISCNNTISNDCPSVKDNKDSINYKTALIDSVRLSIKDSIQNKKYMLRVNTTIKCSEKVTLNPVKNRLEIKDSIFLDDWNIFDYASFSSVTQTVEFFINNQRKNKIDNLNIYDSLKKINSSFIWKNQSY